MNYTSTEPTSEYYQPYSSNSSPKNSLPNSEVATRDWLTPGILLS